MRNNYRKICTILLTIIIVLGVIFLLFLNKTYTVTFDTKGGTIYQSVRVHPNEKVVKPENPVMEGHIFMGWYVEDSNQEYDFNSKVTNDITITAKWQAVS